MLFNSPGFIVFFLLVTPTYWLLPHRFRWILLLGASCYFYMAFVPIYILILFFTIVVDYFAGLLIERSSGAKRKRYLLASLAANIGVLAVFKYFNFFNDTIASAASAMGMAWSVPALSLILPIGLSFHTFQAMSYTVEVYRGRQIAERHFGIYALYVMFYPQLVAGPIERPQNLLPQFHSAKRFSSNDFAVGLRLILLGFLKKVVVADNAGVVVDRIYDYPNAHSGPTLILATVLFAFQIYADFSGYSDIAIGAARIMGIRLMTNFNRPYLARSISEFWKRWHISLSTWFRDYVYIPLGGNKAGEWRWQFNLLATFVLSGLWHGANWTFVIWGALNGTYLIVANLSRQYRGRIALALGLDRQPGLHAAIQTACTFFLITIAWVFFRAKNVDSAFSILQTILTDMPRLTSPSFVMSSFVGLQLQVADLLIPCIGILGLFLFDWATERLENTRPIASWPVYGRWAVYYCGILIILLAGRFGEQQFIYFQF